MDSTIKEGFIQQNPSTEDRKEMDSRMKVGLLPPLPPLPLKDWGE